MPYALDLDQPILLVRLIDDPILADPQPVAVGRAVQFLYALAFERILGKLPDRFTDAPLERRQEVLPRNPGPAGLP